MKDIYDFKFGDLETFGFDPHSGFKTPVAV
jgi:thymidylate synthase